MYRRRYRYYRKNPNPLEMIMELLVGIFAGMIFIVLKIFYKLTVWIIRAILNIRLPQMSLNKYQPQAFSEANLAPLRIDPIPESEPESESRYNLRSALITDNENNFLKALEEAIGDQFIIEQQVALSRIIDVKDSNRHFTNYRDFNRIKALSVDYVLCHKDFRFALIIELDDSTHLRLNRIKRDAFLDSVMKSVNLPLLHVRVSDSYDVDVLRADIINKTQHAFTRTV